MTSSKTEVRLDATAENIRGSVNAPIDPARKAVVKKHLGVVGGVVRPVGADGKPRMRGNAHMTFRELIEEILADPKCPDARVLRWRPFGHSVA